MVTIIFIANFMILSMAAAFSPKFAGKLLFSLCFVLRLTSSQPSPRALRVRKYSRRAALCVTVAGSPFSPMEPRPYSTVTLSLKDLKSNNVATVESIVKLMKSGKGLMPAFKNSEEDLQAVAEFVLDAAVGDKW